MRAQGRESELIAAAITLSGRCDDAHFAESSYGGVVGLPGAQSASHMESRNLIGFSGRGAGSAERNCHTVRHPDGMGLRVFTSRFFPNISGSSKTPADCAAALNSTNSVVIGATFSRLRLQHSIFGRCQ